MTTIEALKVLRKAFVATNAVCIDRDEHITDHAMIVDSLAIDVNDANISHCVNNMTLETLLDHFDVYHLTLDDIDSLLCEYMK